MGENRLHSAAAYLLFYRRRSDKPLGPPALQELVLESRNPRQPETAAEGTTEESDSGEGRLGGPSGSGSSSALIGAGVGAANLHGGVGSLGPEAGTQAGSSLMTRTKLHENSLGELHGEPLYGPVRPPHSGEYGNKGASWTFAGLDEDTNDDGERLIGTIDINDEDDAASTTAEMDATVEGSFGGRMETDFNEFEDAQELNNSSNWSTAGRNTPADSTDGWDNQTDQHNLYSDAHEGQDADIHALHLENAGMMGGDDEEELPAVDIYPDPPTPEHEKMD